MNVQDNSPAGKPDQLKIALIGYGKMGRAIEAIALQKGHEVVLRITSQNASELTKENLQKADVAIEFTNPHRAVEHIKTCIDSGTPVVCGSTGWLQQWDEVHSYCLGHHGSLLYASNFSIGVNIFFEINRKLATMMAVQQSYDVTIEEVHHTHKKDAPSGTAITLAEDILHRVPYKTSWSGMPSGDKKSLTITSKRIDPAPGTHIVLYESAIDSIEIKHTAHNREGFARGALLAAEFLFHKQGVFSMKDVLNIK